MKPLKLDDEPRYFYDVERDSVVEVEVVEGLSMFTVIRARYYTEESCYIKSRFCSTDRFIFLVKNELFIELE
jgi:hypothetical protein